MSKLAPHYKKAAAAAFLRQFDSELVITDLEGGGYHLAKRKDGCDLTAEEKRFIAGFHAGWSAAGDILDPT